MTVMAWQGILGTPVGPLLIVVAAFTLGYLIVIDFLKITISTYFWFRPGRVYKAPSRSGLVAVPIFIALYFLGVWQWLPGPETRLGSSRTGFHSHQSGCRFSWREDYEAYGDSTTNV